jgi:molybdenum cofactor cytidylyltransferase
MTAAVVLAAGESSRIGRPKQLLEFRGKTLVHRAVNAALEASCSPVIVVTGDAHAEVKNALGATRAILVQNSHWRQGVGTSVRVAIRHVIDNAPDVDTTLLLVCDQPFVDRHVLRELVGLHSKTGKPIVVSRYAHTLGVPALFHQSIFPELLRLSGDAGAKSIILSNRERVAELPFPLGKVDIDRLEDLQFVTRRGSSWRFRGLNPN